MSIRERQLLSQFASPMTKRRAAINAVLRPFGFIAWRNRKRFLGFDIVRFEPLIKS